MTPPISPIRQDILLLLDRNGGSVSGTMRLAEQIQATYQAVVWNLRICQHTGLINSIHSPGGRGHKSLHRLTSKGRKYVQPK